MVLPQDHHLARLRPEGVTIQEKNKLDAYLNQGFIRQSQRWHRLRTESSSDCDDGLNVNAVVLFMRHDRADGLDNNDQVDGSHTAKMLIKHHAYIGLDRQ